MKFISKPNYASPHSDSLRCTIPKEIVNELNISKGDSIVWCIQKNDDNDDVVITVEKLEL